MSQAQGYLDATTAWLQVKLHREDVEVTKVDTYGTEWAGDTMSGFHDEFSVTLHWQDEDGESSYTDVAGEELERLWNWMVKEAWSE